MHASQPQLVWYVSYGSNLGWERFLCYVRGGRAPGSRKTHPGCSDQSLPRADRLVDIPFGLYFAGESPVWGGGVAFIEHTAGSRLTKTRAYLVTLPQFEEIVAQESDRPHATINLKALMRQGQLVIGTGMYDRLLYCGMLEGFPLVSFTMVEERAVLAQPAINYIRSLAKGLWNAYDLRPQEIARYLGAVPGAGYSPAELHVLLAQPRTEPGIMATGSAHSMEVVLDV